MLRNLFRSFVRKNRKSSRGKRVVFPIDSQARVRMKRMTPGLTALLLIITTTVVEGRETIQSANRDATEAAQKVLDYYGPYGCGTVASVRAMYNDPAVANRGDIKLDDVLEGKINHESREGKP